MKAPGGNISGDGAVINSHTLLIELQTTGEKKNGSAEGTEGVLFHINTAAELRGPPFTLL